MIGLKYHHAEKVRGGVQLAGHCKHAVGISGHGEEAGGSGDGTAGGADGGNLRGVQLAGSANMLWAYATVWRKLGKRVMGKLEGRAEAISGEFNSQAVSNTFWEYADTGEETGKAGDGATGGAVGGDIRRVRLAASFKHAVGVCDHDE